MIKNWSASQGGYYLDLLFQLALETCPNHFPLTRLEAIRNAWDRANVVGHGEKNELLVDEVGKRNLVRVVIEVGPGLRRAMNKMYITVWIKGVL